MKNTFMNKRNLNVGGIACLMAGVYCMCYILLNDNALPGSIAAVEGSLSHWVRHWHVVVVGLMPIYVACALFGAAICSLTVGSTLYRWLSDFMHQK
jgi:hypothetical protein